MLCRGIPFLLPSIFNFPMKKIFLFLFLLSSANSFSLPTNFVYLKDLDPSIYQEIRYAGTSNFIGRPIPGYKKPRCILTQNAAQALLKVQNELIKNSLSLKIFDCYRPQKSVDHFSAWAKDVSDQKMKASYYPEVSKDQLFNLGYIASRSGHSRGSTVDLTLIREDKSEVDMGTPFDFFSPLSHTENSSVTPEQKKNRLFLKSAMEKHGFINLPEEWWHYTLKREPFLDQYFDFDVE